MVRGKVNLQKIQDPVNRRVTLCKRKAGLLKKAKEISVLCEAEIGLIIFSPTGKLSEFASPSMCRIMRKYQKFVASTKDHIPSDEHVEILRSDVEYLHEEMTRLEKKYNHMKGEQLNLLNFEELKYLEKKMSLGVSKIRSRKNGIQNMIQIGRSHKPCHLNIGMIEEVNDRLETEAATQQDLPQTILNLTLS